MLNLSTNQLLSLWMELEDAYHGVNIYDGNAAEIYMYRLHPNGKAVQSLYAVLTKFADERDCRITIDGKKLGKWFLTTTPQTHRYVIGVRHTHLKK